ncbi:MAG: ABC transporter permease [Anaerolineae bacterium]|nr:ABC transporter permease [Anaerolineae bacterium]
MRSFIYLYIATVREFRRDFSALFWTLAFPIMFIAIFGVIFSNEGDISFDLGVVNEDGAASAPLAASFEEIGAFEVTTGTREDELAALKDGDRAAVIVIPAGTGAALDQYFSRLTESGESGESADPANPAPLEIFYDPADQTTSQVVINLVDKVVAGMNEQMTGIPPALTVQSQEVSADDLRSIDYLLPGVIAMSLMQLGLFATAAPLVSLREKQVLRRMGATPLSKTTLLASQVAFRVTTALIQFVLIVAVGYIIFDVHIEMGNLPAILGVVILGAMTFIVLGYVLAGLAKTEEAVQGIISLPNFIFMFLSGIFFPVDMMPNWMRPVVDVIPLTYLGDALRQTMIDAGSYFSMTRSVVILAAWLVICAGLAVRVFRWEPQA